MDWEKRHDMEEKRRLYRGKLNSLKVGYCGTPEESIRLYSFAIDVLGRELASRDTLRLIGDTGYPDTYDLHKNIHHQGYTVKQDVDVSAFNVITRIEKIESLVQAAENIQREGFEEMPHEESKGALFPDIGLVFITNRRHHLAVAKGRGPLKIKKLTVIQYDNYDHEMMENLFLWAYEYSDKTLNGLNDPFFQVAIMLELAKEIRKLDASGELTQSQMRLREIERENRHLRQQARALENELASLRK